jgi:methyl-accepting chemotaxis protein
MFDHWTLKKRLTLTFAAILLLASALIGMALYSSAKLRSTVSWNAHTHKVLATAQAMLLNMVNIETGLRGFVAGADEKFLEPYKSGEQAFGTAFQEARTLTADNPAQQGRLDKMMASHKEFMAVASAISALRRDVNAGKVPVETLLREFSAGKDKVAMDAFRAGVAEFAQAEQGLLVARAAALDDTMSVNRSTLLLGGLGLVALTAVLGVALTRGVFRQLGAEPSEAAAAVNAVAQGDLSAHIPVRAGDTTSLLAALARMRDGLVTVVSGVRGNSESVASASAQIAQGNQDLSGRTEQQASALQQTAATMEELGTTVRHNADSARQANQLAQGASTVAERGGEVVSKVVTTMQGINQSSRKISDIISVIDGIAFQTNILALNAAVEAARAGEQGRGFAVVASEVRSLAQRSAEAAKEIKTLISRSVEQVEQGSTLVDEAGQTMDEIVGSIRRVTDIVAEISAASVEQSSGVQQVGQAVTQMDQATQQNAALVEESAAAAESLKHQAQQLVQAVAVFKLGRHDTSAPVAAQASTRPAAPAVKRSEPARTVSTARPAPKAKPADKQPQPSALASADADSWETF